MIDYSQKLNSEQLAAVLNGDGPCLVLAGAGSGKTRTITYRVARLLETGVSPSEILLVTFTNKAAAEMNRRVVELTGGGRLPWSGTFHHIAYRILKIYAPLLGFGNNFTVLDSDDSQVLLKAAIKEARGRDEAKFPSPAVVGGMISFARSSLRPLPDVIAEKYPAWERFSAKLSAIAERYAQKKKEANAFDFDDLLTNLLLLLGQPNIAHKYATQFHYVLVDEYQDTNRLQAAIVKKFAAVHHNLLVVGDDAQSIYSFRAAEIENILEFEREYPGTKIFKLESNYRSTPEIVSVASASIANNRSPYRKQLRATLPSGAKPILHPEVDQAAEALYVVKEIKAAFAAGVATNEIAVLFRASHHSQRLELELSKAGIAYEYRGGVRFFDRAHIKDVLSFLRILYNLKDAAAWLRLLLHQEGIGPAAAEKMIRAVQDLGNATDVANLGFQLLGQKAQVGWRNFVAVWEPLLQNKTASPGELVELILASPYREFLETEFIDSRDRIEDIKQLAVFAAQYQALEDFLNEASLQESFALGRDANQKSAGGAEGKIILSTIHQAKGLEWSRVFIINLSSGAFPNDRSLRERKGLEEERRLFYVALTRAKDQLHLSYPLAGGAFGDMLAGPSPFVEELSLDLLEDHSLLLTDSPFTSASVFNDPVAGVTYVDEDQPRPFKKNSFLREIEDL